MGSTVPDTGALDEPRLRQLIEVGRALVSELDPEAILRRVLEVACELTGARYAALGVLDPERRHLERFITRGIDERTRAAIGDLPRGHGVLGMLIEQPQPLRLTDVGSHPRSYGFPVGHPPMQTFLGVPIVIRGQAWGNLYLTEKEGGEFDEADEQLAVVLAEWTAIAVENARLYQSVESQRDELRNAVRGLEATTEIARAIGGETDLDRILETIVKRGRALVEAKGMLILLREGSDLVVVAAAGEFHRDLIGTRVEVGGSISGHVLETRRAERLANVGNQLRFALSKFVDVRTGLFVPLSFRGEPLGVLNAFDRRRRRGVQQGGPAPAGGLRRQRRGRGRDRAVGRREPPPRQPRSDRARAPALGAGAARRGAAERGRGAGADLQRPPRRRRRGRPAAGPGTRSGRQHDRGDAAADRRPAPPHPRRAGAGGCGRRAGGKTGAGPGDRGRDRGRPRLGVRPLPDPARRPAGGHDLPPGPGGAPQRRPPRRQRPRAG